MFENHDWHILIVDDNPTNRDLLSRMLERENYQSTQAANGQEALTLLQKENFDAMLLDIMMPVMDGYQVLETIRQDENLRYLPVIVISAVDDIQSIIRCIQMGAEDYLFKPFNKTMLKARLEASLEKKYYFDQLQIEREKSEQLLLNILPKPIAQRLKQGEETIADNHADVSVMFADLVNFTPLAAHITPDELIVMLNKIFSEFDSLCEQHALEKIKTIGDSYIAVGNLLVVNKNHHQAIAQMALNMSAVLEKYNQENNGELAIRIGLHCGPVVAGVLGKQKFFYDLWGETVNTASRLESHSETGRVHVSQDFFERTQDNFHYEVRGEVEMKGLKTAITYFLQGKK